MHQVAALLGDIRGGGARQPLEVAAAAAHALLVGEGDLDTAHRLLVASLSLDSGAGAAGVDAPTARMPALYSLFEICIYAARPAAVAAAARRGRRTRRRRADSPTADDVGPG